MSTEIKPKSDHSRASSNKGRLVGQKRPLRPKEARQRPAKKNSR
jgi:hypothetical protein